MNPSSRSARPLRRLVAAAAIALVPAIAGCEAGNNAPTFQWHQPTPAETADFTAVTASAHYSVTVNNMFVLGPAPGFHLMRGGSAGLYFALTNTGAPDRLVSISAPGTARSVRLPAGGIKLGSEQTVLLSGPVATAVLEGLRQPLTGGTTLRLVMDFQNLGAHEVTVPVIPRSGDYATFSPAPRSPSPSPSPTPTGTAHAHHRGGPTSSASPSPTPSS